MKSSFPGGAVWMVFLGLGGFAAACGGDDAFDEPPPSEVSSGSGAGREDASVDERDAATVQDATAPECGDHAREVQGECVCDEGFHLADDVCTSSRVIAFVSERSGNDEIYVMALDGSHVERLTDSPGFDRAPAWSPDATQLAFNSRRAPHADRPEIYRVELATRAITRITDSSLENHRASFSADGSAVVFQRGALPEGFGLFRQALATGELISLQAWPGKWVAAGSLSPDGGRLVFQSNHESTEMFPFRLYVRDLATEDVVELAAHAAGSVDGPRWSPDGARIAFASSRDPQGSHLYVVDVASGAVEQITHGEVSDGAPDWSPDGTALVFQSDRRDEDGGIHVVDLHTRTVRYVGEGRTPVWSPRR